MNADMLTIKMQSFHFQRLLRKSTPPPPFFSRYMPSTSLSHLAERDRWVTIRLKSAGALQRSKRIGHLHFFGNPHMRHQPWANPLADDCWKAGKRSKNCSLEPEPQLMRPASLNLGDACLDLIRSNAQTLNTQTHKDDDALYRIPHKHKRRHS